MKCNDCVAEYHHSLARSFSGLCPDCECKKRKIDLADNVMGMLNALIGMTILLGLSGILYVVVWAVLAGFAAAFGMPAPPFGDFGSSDY